MIALNVHCRLRAYATRIAALALSALVLAPTSVQAQTARPPGTPAGASTASVPAPASIDDKFLQVAQRVPQFGGLYLRGNMVQVVLVDTSPQIFSAAQDAIVEVFGRDRLPPGGFNAIQGQYGVQRLKGMRDQARVLLGIPGVSVLDLDERLNRIRVGIDGPDVRSAVERQLDALHVPLDAVVIQQVTPTEPMWGTKDLVRPLKGALQITNNIFKTCTLGLVVKRAGVRGMVTASHCTNDQGGTEYTVFSQPTPGNHIAVEKVDPVYLTSAADGNCPSGRRCRWSDTSFSAILDGISSYRGTIAHPSFPEDPGNLTIGTGSWPGDYNVESAVSLPIGGELLGKFGRTTGFSKGEVTDTCEDVNVNKTNITLWCQNRVEAAVDHGDSGSPVFANVGSFPYGVAFYGFLWGGRTDKSSFSFSAMTNTEVELGSLDVLQAFDPPSINILTPANGSKVDANFFTTFTASVTDLDAHCPNSCPVKWHSDKDGDMGTGLSVNFVFLTPGTRTVTATATKLNLNGLSSSASISVSTTNEAPKVWITKPSSGQALVMGAAYVFEGHSSDKELFGPLPCSALKWTSTMAGDPVATGCGPTMVFATPGLRVITLTGTDAEGLTWKASVGIFVQAPKPGSPPIVSISAPGPLASLEPFKFAILKGTASDPDLSGPLTYEWQIKDGSTLTTIATGTLVSGGPANALWQPSVTVPPSCGGSWAKLYLYVTDADGATAFDVRDIEIHYTAC